MATNSYKESFGYSMLNGIVTSNTIPYNLFEIEHKKGLGAAHCATCKQDGMFEGIFYGLCATCCETSGRCPCVYCRVAEKDGHKRVERRINLCKFIKEIQIVIADLRRDYPNDEYGIVKEGVESGFYILNLHTKAQYEKMSSETEFPDEINKLEPDDVAWIWDPLLEVSETSCIAALKAANRMGIYEWVKALWSGTKYESLIMSSEEIQQVQQIIQKSQKILEEVDRFLAVPVNEKKHDICIQCEYIMPINCGKCTSFECMDEEFQDDYDVQCSECETWIPTFETDERGYCRDCQNPEYDPAWPMGD